MCQGRDQAAALTVRERLQTEDGSSVTTLKPHQPDPKTIVSQKLADKTLKIPETIISGLPWASLHPRC